MFACYRDLWKTASEKRNAVKQGIIYSGGCPSGCMKLQINASNKDATNKGDVGIANTYQNKFIIPLDFEMLDSAMPYHHLGLRNRLLYEITFNNYDRVIVSPGSSLISDAKYKIADVSLGYKIITQPDLTRHITMEYQSMALPYDRVLRDRQIQVNKSDMTWSWSFNMPCRSLKGILTLFEAEQLYE